MESKEIWGGVSTDIPWLAVSTLESARVLNEHQQNECHSSLYGQGDQLPTQHGIAEGIAVCINAKLDKDVCLHLIIEEVDKSRSQTVGWEDKEDFVDVVESRMVIV